MVDFSDLGTIVDITENLTDIDVPGVGKDKSAAGRLGPVRGARLEYEVKELGGRLLMKEPFGFFFALDPIYPEYGKFESGEHQQGKLFTKRAGFRFKSYTILLKPGTKMKVPKARAADQRKRDGDSSSEEITIGNISIGVSSSIAVNEFIEWLKTSKKKQQVIGIISPTLRKYQWGGVLHQAK